MSGYFDELDRITREVTPHINVARLSLDDLKRESTRT